MAFRVRGSFRAWCGDLTTEGTEEHRGKRFVGAIDCCIHIGFAKSFTAKIAELNTEGAKKNFVCPPA